MTFSFPHHMTHSSSPLNQFLSSPFKHMQTYLSTIKREIAKNSAARCVLLLSLPSGTLKLNPILQIVLHPPPSGEQELSEHQA